MDLCWYQSVKSNLPKSRMSPRIFSPFFLLQLTFNIVVLGQSLCRVWLFVTSWAAASYAPLSSTISRNLLKFMSIESVMLSNHISSATAFSFYLHSFPVSGSFPMSCLLSSGGQSTEGSTSTSVLPMNIQGRLPLELTGLNSFQSQRLSRVFCSTTFWNYRFFRT